MLERLAPQVGLEPTTLRLTAECSAIELLRIRSGNVPRRRTSPPIFLSYSKMGRSRSKLDFIPVVLCLFDDQGGMVTLEERFGF